MVAKQTHAGVNGDCPLRPFGGAEDFAWHPNSQHLVYVWPLQTVNMKERIFILTTNALRNKRVANASMFSDLPRSAVSSDEDCTVHGVSGNACQQRRASRTNMLDSFVGRGQCLPVV